MKLSERHIWIFTCLAEDSGLGKTEGVFSSDESKNGFGGGEGEYDAGSTDRVDARSRSKQETKTEELKLYEQIGRLKMKINWLKKCDKLD